MSACWFYWWLIGRKSEKKSKLKFQILSRIKPKQAMPIIKKTHKMRPGKTNPKIIHRKLEKFKTKLNVVREAVLKMKLSEINSHLIKFEKKN